MCSGCSLEIPSPTNRRDRFVSCSGNTGLPSSPRSERPACGGGGRKWGCTHRLSSDLDPFPDKPPRQIRVVLWQYWFTKLAEKRATGMWWRREEVGLYAPTLERSPDGEMQVVELPTVPPRP